MDKATLKRRDESREKRLRELEHKMTKQQADFCKHLVSTNNASAAAAMAGSKAKRPDQVAHQWMQKEEIIEYIELLREKASYYSTLTDVEVVEKTRDIYTKAMEDRNFKEANIAVRTLAEIKGLINGKAKGPAQPAKTEEPAKPQADSTKKLEDILGAL